MEKLEWLSSLACNTLSDPLHVVARRRGSLASLTSLILIYDWTNLALSFQAFVRGEVNIGDHFPLCLQKITI